MKQNFSLKFDNSLFSVLLFFPILHFWGEGVLLLKPLFFLVVGVVGLLFFWKKRKISMPFLTAVFVFCFVIFLFLAFLFQKDWQLFPYLYLLSLFLFYKIELSFLESEGSCNKNRLIISVYVVLIGLETLFFIGLKNTYSIHFYTNDSFFSILVASHLLFVIPYFKDNICCFLKSKKWIKTVFFCFLILCYTLLIYTKGRAGILGFTIGLVVLHYDYLKCKVGFWKGFLISSSLIIALIIYKNDSSNGRLLIYKVIATQVVPQQLLTGIGYGEFKATYNQLQANYFSEENINSSEAILADDTRFVFNDSLQFMLEMGLIGLLVLLFLLLKFHAFYKEDFRLFPEEPMLQGAYLSVICIIISSLFFYSFQVVGILLHFIFCVAIIYKKRIYIQQSGVCIQTKNPINRIVLLFASICVLYFGRECFNFYKQSREAILFSKTGYRKKALHSYYELSNSFIKDAGVLCNYSNELSQINKVDSAIIVLHKASRYSYNDNIALSLGDLLYEKQRFPEAEEQYKKAIFMNPKMFFNRKKLLDFYYETKQFKKAIYWRNSILKMPIKVPSKTVDAIKNDTQKMIIEMNRQIGRQEFE